MIPSLSIGLPPMALTLYNMVRKRKRGAENEGQNIWQKQIDISINFGYT
jgi:hypothetical protein